MEHVHIGEMLPVVETIECSLADAEVSDCLEPIREVWIHDEGFAASRLSMMRIMARRTKAATVMA
jgi:hypothetical protein